MDDEPDRRGSIIHRVINIILTHAARRETMVLEVEDMNDGEKHSLAVALGRRGGVSRAGKLSPERRSEIARAAAVKRWGRKESA
jgi:hypothetical protein